MSESGGTSATAAPLIPIPQKFDVAVEDVEYLRHASEPLLARLYRPVGDQPAVAIVDVHGGAWVVGHRLQHQAMDQALAANGILVAAVDFRQPPGNPYPASLQDVNFAIRWLKQHAVALGAGPGCRIGAFGGSSGGHVVILSAMRPRDPRYATLPLSEATVGAAGARPADASLDFVVTDAPVTDPYARYLNARAAGRTDIVERHHLYWPSDADAIEGNPNLILERGESVDLPPLLITQGTDDQSVPLAITRQFVERYQQAGGNVQLLTFDGLGHGFILQDPTRPESVQQAEAVLDFIERQTR